MEINDGEVTGTENAGLDLNLSNSTPTKFNRTKITLMKTNSQEIALDMDHILQCIFSYLDIETLKSCRFIAARWKIFGATELQKFTTLSLNFNLIKSWSGKKRKSVPDQARGSRSSENAIVSLLSLLETTDKFPCSSFRLWTYQFSSPNIQKIFASIGTHIRILDLHYATMPDITESFESSRFVECFRTLLTYHAINLESLRTYFFMRRWEGEIQDWNSNPEKYFFPNFPCSSTSNSRIRILLPKLKSLTINSTFPPKMFKEILNAACNLSSVSLFPILGCLRYSNLKPLLEYFLHEDGKDRIHLIKHLIFYPTDDMVLIFEELFTIHRHELYIETLVFDKFYDCGILPDFWGRVTRIINKLFESSAKTIKKLDLIPLRFFSDIKIPLMPKLTTIRLSNFSNFVVVNGRIRDPCYFPCGFSIARNFPNLQCIFCKHPLDDKFWMRLDMSNILEPVVSVKRIKVVPGFLTQFQSCNGCKDSDLAHLRASVLFPNATIEGCHK